MVKNKAKKDNNMVTSDEFILWIKKLDKNAINLWKESLANLRQLHGDIWNGVRFFLTINGIIVAAIIALPVWMISILSTLLIGLCIIIYDEDPDWVYFKEYHINLFLLPYNMATNQIST